MPTATKKHDNIAQALAAFQLKVPSIEKTSTADTGKYKYDYAPLDKVVGIILPLLAEQGMSFTAAPNLREDGAFVLRAALLHESGEKIEGDYPLGDPRTPAQQIGSAITYARRYALTALTGVAPGGEDDDGAAAQQARPVADATPAEPKETAFDILKKVGALIDSGKITKPRADEIAAGISSKDLGKFTIAEAKKVLAAVEAETQA